jgi:hypothetical protein
MQDEIAQIEADLEELDKKNMWSPDLVHNGTFREEHEQERTNLLGLLATKLKAYGEFCSISANWIESRLLYSKHYADISPR